MNTLMKRTNGNMPATTFSGLVDRLFQNNVNRFFDDDSWGFNGVAHNVHVPVNIRETEKGYELQSVAPGLKKESRELYRLMFSSSLSMSSAVVITLAAEE